MNRDLLRSTVQAYEKQRIEAMLSTPPLFDLIRQRGATSMQSVRVKKDELLSLLVKNREEHVRGYKAAVDGYRAAALQAVDVASKRLRRRVERLERGETISMASIAFGIGVPENHTDDYDRAIRMLEMSVEDVVNLDARTFECFVNDNWGWKQNTIRGWDGYNINSIGFVGRHADRLVTENGVDDDDDE